jgi:hypothetical protein
MTFEAFAKLIELLLFGDPIRKLRWQPPRRGCG